MSDHLYNNATDADSSDLLQQCHNNIQNADPSVVALLQPLSAAHPPASSSSRRRRPPSDVMALRQALIKLQQATLRGRSTYAAKLLEMSLQDVQHDKQMHDLLATFSARLDQQQRQRQQQKQAQRISGQTHSSTDEDDDNDDIQDDNRRSKTKNTTTSIGHDKVTDEEGVARLKSQLAQEGDRADALQKKVTTLLRQEIQSLQQEQASIQERQTAWQTRFQSLQSTLQNTNNSSSSNLPDADHHQALQNDLVALQTYQLAGPSTTYCTVCLDAPATRAVIPCGHLCLCDTCTKEQQSSDEYGTTAERLRQCPLCRGHILSTLKIYIAK